MILMFGRNSLWNYPLSKKQRKSFIFHLFTDVPLIWYYLVAFFVLDVTYKVYLRLCFVCWQYVCDKLMEVYGIECTTDNVLNLDSSTEDKFSRHLIFNLQNAAFKDNIHVGMFLVVYRWHFVFHMQDEVMHSACFFRLFYSCNSAASPKHTQK